MFIDMKKYKTSDIMLIIGLVILLAGAVMSYLKFEPYADYTLVAGAVVVIFRGAFRARERDDNMNNENRE